jgi:hypothetical protein
MSTKKRVHRSASQLAVAHLARQFEQWAQRFREAAAQNDYLNAAQAAEAALKLQPGNLNVAADLAFALMRSEDFARAHCVYLQIYKARGGRQKSGETWLDGLVEVCGWLGRSEDVRRYGNESLSLASERLINWPAVAIPAGGPPAFEADYPERNIIAFTLFGDSPRYCESAIMNAQVAKELFPHWRCRFYLDDSVPAQVQRRLREQGAQVVNMTSHGRDGVHPLMWRFLVADDPTVSRFLIRDADSLLSEREHGAVQEWLYSDRWFHHMRDYFTHTELILAGLWGGCRGMLPPLKPLMQTWLARQNDVTRFADQIFLREMVWPTFRQSVLNHDELFGFHDARPFPAHPPIRWDTQRFHVGSNASFQGVEGRSSKADGELQGWQLQDEQGSIVCEYQARVRDRKWRSDLPFFQIAHVKDGRWRIHLTD